MTLKYKSTWIQSGTRDRHYSKEYDTPEQALEAARCPPILGTPIEGTIQLVYIDTTHPNYTP